jgi:hypothetical protein
MDAKIVTIMRRVIASNIRGDSLDSILRPGRRP